MINKQQIECHFGRMAKQYDEYAVVQKKMGEYLQKLVVESGPFETILEIGSGTGFFTKKLAKLYPSAQITTSDISLKMLQAAKANLVDFSNIQYILADGENLAMTTKFDLIVSNAAFQWFNDYNRAFKQLMDKLKPGGRLIYATFGKQTFYELKQAFSTAEKKLNLEKSGQHGPDFISIEQLSMISQKLDMQAEFKEENMIENFSSVKEFLLSVKKIGANNAVKEGEAFVNRSLMLRMMKEYEQQFLKRGCVPATYHVIYGKHRKAAL